MLAKNGEFLSSPFLTFLLVDIFEFTSLPAAGLARPDLNYGRPADLEARTLPAGRMGYCFSGLNLFKLKTGPGHAGQGNWPVFHLSSQHSFIFCGVPVSDGFA